MNRTQRIEIAKHTAAILESGSYTTDSGTPIDLRASLGASCAATQLYLPDTYPALLAEIEHLPPVEATTIGVSNCTTLAAGRALAPTYPALACLNFASAKNPGGGFLSGAEAQEESLARSSGLYATLQTQPAFYAHHRQQRSSIYSDRVIVSPAVPVFRDDNGALLEQPWQTAFLTAAAVNAGALRQNEPDKVADIEAAMTQRARMVFGVAAAQRCDALVLGAWGCGVFRNDPAVVAAIFGAVLREPAFARRFRHIEFAVLDPSSARATIAPFERLRESRFEV